MSKILFIGRTEACSYECAPFLSLLSWVSDQKIVALDTETNMTDSILNRVLKVISIADEQGDENWVIEYGFLNPSQQRLLFTELKKKLCIIQNASFDYQVVKKQGYVFEKLYDTMLGEQNLTNGYASEQSFHGLQAIYKRRFDIDISKAEQTTFGTDNPLSDEQIRYAAIDVLKLGSIRNLQISEMKHEDSRISQKGNRGLMKTNWWENEFVKAVGDMETSGVFIDKDLWYKVEDDVKPIWDEELRILNDIVKNNFWDVLEENNWISDVDRFTSNVWSSSAKKSEILGKIFDFPIEKTSMLELKKLLQENDPEFPQGLKLSGKAWESSDYPYSFTSKFSVLKLLLIRNKDKERFDGILNKFLLSNFRDFCIEKEWLIPANQISLKWSSPVQRLKIFQAIDPNIDTTNKEFLADYVDKHRLIPHYLEWARVDFMKKSFGKAFYDKYVDLDGRFRSRFRQILATGRMSSTSPNLLAIPGKDMYRNCFTAQEGHTLIGADYDGEELLIAGTLSGEPEWIKAFSNGWDLHSINAAVIYGEEWDSFTEPDCRFAAEKKKCKCKGHMELRDPAKTIEFGTIYGMGAPTLAARLKITVREAQDLIDSFFEGLPLLRAYLSKVQNFAINNGFIIEPVFGRIRYYDKWKLSVPEEHAGIGRTAGNYTIQSPGSAILKIFAVLFRRWINHNNLQGSVKLLLLVHDECLVDVDHRVTEVEPVKAKVEHYMMLAAKLAGFPLLKAKAASGTAWGSVH